MGQCFPLLVETDKDLLGLGFGPIGSGNYLIHGNREVIDGKCFIVGLRDQLDLDMLVTLLWKGTAVSRLDKKSSFFHN